MSAPIKIKIVGLSKTGKSTVARLIMNHLSELGLITNLKDEPKSYNDDYNLSSKLNTLIDKNVTVEIKTVSARRDGTFYIEELKDGEPCKHNGCLNHISHPCEGCGRIAGGLPVTKETKGW